MTPAQAGKIIEEYLDFLPADGEIEAAFFGGSFTGLTLEKQEAFLQTAAAYRGRISGIRMSTRPDYINDDVLTLAKCYGVTTIELGLQSADDTVLFLNGRGHRFADTESAAAKIHAYGIKLGLQMMVGMYGSTREKDMDTARHMLALSPDCVRIYPTVVLRNTALETLYQTGKYQPYTLEQAIEVSAEILLLMHKENIPVIRLGLHASEELQSAGDLVAGPFHPAFGELTESFLWRRKLEKKVQEQGIRNQIWTVAVPAREISKVIGHKKINQKYLFDKYGITLRCVQAE